MQRVTGCDKTAVTATYLIGKVFRSIPLGVYTGGAGTGAHMPN